MAVLGKPALNFAFADGVERYHTAHDNVTYLNPGSLQHHGVQMLTLARAFGDGPLPRPATSDAVFFDAPIVGLIVYPESAALPIAIFATVLVLAAVGRLVREPGRWASGIMLGALGTVGSACAALGLALVTGNGIVSVHDAMGWGGASAFRGVYTAAVVMLAVTVSLAGWALVRRWAAAAPAQVGALVVWCILTLFVSVKVPGVSFLFAWPLIFAAIAALATRSSPTDRTGSLTPTVASDVLGWTAVIVGLVVVVPIVYAVSAVLLGMQGPGGVAAGALVALLAWLLAPQLEAMGGRRWWPTTLSCSRPSCCCASG